MGNNSSVSEFDSSPMAGSVRTNSPLKKWWLTFFCGYRVNSIPRAPKSGFFGRIAYTKTWTLKEKE
jgi:hypothetical protein